MLLFSDCLLLIRSQEESVAITYIVVRELPNFKYFRNMVQVIDEQKYYVLQLK